MLRERNNKLQILYTAKHLIKSKNKIKAFYNYREFTTHRCSLKKLLKNMFQQERKWSQSEGGYDLHSSPRPNVCPLIHGRTRFSCTSWSQAWPWDLLWPRKCEQKRCIILLHGSFKSQLKSRVPFSLCPSHPHSSIWGLPLQWLQNAGVEPLAKLECEQEIKLCCLSHRFLKLFVTTDTRTIIQNRRDYRNWSNMLEILIKDKL